MPEVHLDSLDEDQHAEAADRDHERSFEALHFDVDHPYRFEFRPALAASRRKERKA